MRVIKLDAIDSTNEFLKQLDVAENLENFTVVTAENQTKGKGQMGSVWDSEVGKNLVMSVLLKNIIIDVNAIFTLNIAVALAIYKALETVNIPALSIKWPNDIMSYNYKLGGILIENSLKSDGAIVSIVGVGLNVNQTNFENLPKASSMAAVSKVFHNKEQLLFLIMENLKNNINLIATRPEILWGLYSDYLFKKSVPMPFKGVDDKNFMGIIQGVSPSGKLQVLLDDDSTAAFNIKEVQLLY
ncbi:biotin--[acetyl-CoA-carboxylase] ligase [Flavobacterium sp. F-380]|uniref:Biotin--[acetyl-CoA-carboxylase] ligase n=1 Tax=Flavobacterium kayseriense TaxID=2764714 RepID=A0ABR7J9J9_9FLAO|nr:biotin--[acetyl-CoA-carboxylase] ligase [Flavobacterium kayseriense]MBC5842216.1 biotin--[acetyl-CoA-carboxylase] ligase [Flavobacterium kayseriense]MBC5848746.1 biotin--[acetyl-CoA-carboxylase] ligase [Flavobacterium kayseriense]